MQRKRNKRKLKTVDVVIQELLHDKTYSNYSPKRLEDEIQKILKSVNYYRNR